MGLPGNCLKSEGIDSRLEALCAEGNRPLFRAFLFVTWRVEDSQMESK